MKTFRDAVHGDMQFDPVEMSVIDTPAMQRLRGIKQLGTSNLVFPSAAHSRFEHSLGTCWTTKKLFHALEAAGQDFSEEDRRIATLAALLHDVTHVPFGHTFEDERRLFARHDEDPERIAHFLDSPPLARALALSGVGERVRNLLMEKQSKNANARFLRDIVTGTVCADLLDYLKRDAFHCGLVLGYDERLFQYFQIEEGRLVVRLHKSGTFRRDALSELVHLLQIRYTLTERVYYHHAKVVAGAMVSRALELAMASQHFASEELYSLRDDSLLARLGQLGSPRDGWRDVLEDLESRRLYKRVYFLTLEGFGRPGLSELERDALAMKYHTDLEQRRSAERWLAEQLGVPEAHVILYCPSPRMSLKEADVPVEVSPGVVQPLASLEHPDVKALTEKHRGLWRLYVCLRRDHGPLFARAGELCEQLLGHPNQLESLQRGGLAFGK
ncbi:MAG: HD domain-containing protein [Planctomycetota bacterium]